MVKVNVSFKERKIKTNVFVTGYMRKRQRGWGGNQHNVSLYIPYFLSHDRNIENVHLLASLNVTIVDQIQRLEARNKAST